MNINRVGVLLVILVGLITLSCGLSSEVTPTPTQPVPLQGRILLLGNDADNGLSILEFKEGLSAPQPLWTGIPGRVNDPSVKPLPVIIASPDHQHALVMLEISAILILDLTDGTSTRIVLPERDLASEEQYDLAGEFSPDSRYLAYALNGKDSTHSGMYLYDLTTQKQSTLFEGPCATYGGATIGLVCGEVEPPAWLDATILAFNAFDGEPPQTHIGRAIQSNHTFVMDVTGKRLHDFGPLEDIPIQSAKGPTVLEKYGLTWLEAADLKRGQIIPHSLEGNPVHHFWTLTPDGLSALRWQRVRHNVQGNPFDDSWHLTNLRSGADQELQNLSYCDTTLNIITYGLWGIVWSPDGKSFTCQSGSSLRVSYLNDIPPRTLLGTFYGYLIDWTP